MVEENYQYYMYFFETLLKTLILVDNNKLRLVDFLN